jgi:hypothetical protein
MTCRNDASHTPSQGMAALTVEDVESKYVSLLLTSSFMSCHIVKSFSASQVRELTSSISVAKKSHVAAPVFGVV